MIWGPPLIYWGRGEGPLIYVIIIITYEVRPHVGALISICFAISDSLRCVLSSGVTPTPACTGPRRAPGYRGAPGPEGALRKF